jgi:hypothetical protein
MAASCATREKAISAGSETSYSGPISALPRNQNTPYPVLNTPYAVPRRSAETIPATAVRMIDSCAPMPTPQSAMTSNTSPTPQEPQQRAQHGSRRSRVVAQRAAKRQRAVADL